MTGRDREAERGEGALPRWSRLKRAQRERDEAVAVDDPRAAEAPAIERAPAAPEPCAPKPGVEASEAPGTVRVEDLPDIESLTFESDFTVFLAKGVPKALRSRALKKLWRSNPVLANLDGLNDHDLDYRQADIRTLAARSLEDLARGTKRLIASDRAAEPPARSGPELARKPAPALDRPAARADTATPASEPAAPPAGTAASQADPDAG